MFSNPVIEFDQVTKVYPAQLRAAKKVALDAVSFVLPHGECLGLIGANGAGKSTSLRLLMDFIRPDRGQILLFGESPGRYDVRTRVGYLPEVAGFPANLTVVDMLNFAGRSCGLARREILERSEQLLKRLELWKVRKHPLRSYSKGMQQRASFCVALINDPQLLILDEPMSGLDPIGREKIISLVLELKQQGKSILFCSHILEDVDRLVDSLLVLHQGQRLFSGTVPELCRNEETATLAEAFLSLVQRGDHV